MRLNKLAIVILCSSFALGSYAQNSEGYEGKYRPFSIYAGAGPSLFINNLVMSKDDVKPFKYAISARFMWEPKNSFVSLGIESGYYKLYTVSSSSPKADVSNSAIPILFVVSMKFGKKFYGDFCMGQSVTKSKVSNTDSSYNFNSSTWSFSDFSAAIGYRFVQKQRISYSAELKGFYSSGYENATIALLFIVGFKL